jgi:hypothetical protein
MDLAFILNLDEEKNALSTVHLFETTRDMLSSTPKWYMKFGRVAVCA